MYLYVCFISSFLEEERITYVYKVLSDVAKFVTVGA